MLRAEFLSGFKLTDGAGGEIHIRDRKAKALFAFLALNSARLHTREKLATLLWDSTCDRVARQSFRKCLSRLRLALGDLASSALVINNDLVGIDPTIIELDALALKHRLEDNDLEQAAELLSGGDLLEGLNIDVEPFNEWLTLQRDQYRDLAIEVLNSAARELSGRGDLKSALKTAQTLLDLDPTNEQGNQLTVDLLASLRGDEAANRQRARYQKLMQQELDVVPSHSGLQSVRPRRVGPLHTAHFNKPVVVIREITSDCGWEANARFARGIFDDLATEFSRYNWLSLIAGDGAGRFLIEGASRLLDGRYKVTIRLISGADGTTLWSETLEGLAEDIIATQHEIATLATSRLIGAIETIESRQTRETIEPVSAISCWQRGTALFHRYAADSSSEAKRMFRHAIELDPEFAPAYASLAYTEQLDALFSHGNCRATSLARALKYAQSAFSMDPLDATCHLALGMVHARLEDFDGATVALETALNLCPSLDRAHHALGLARYYQGQQRVAVNHIDRAIAMNPRSPANWAMRHMRARCCYDLGQYEQALHWANKAVNSPNSQSIATAMKAAAARRAGHHRLARSTVRDLVRRDPAMTTDYLVSTFANEFLADKVQDMAEQLRLSGLPI
jgi:DNA-binding SARP family transcriptional activator/TolB-like protein